MAETVQKDIASVPQNRARMLFWVLGLVILTGLSALALMTGKYPLSFWDVVRLISGKDVTDPIAANVLWNIRVPRLLAGLCVGASLAAAGAAYQGIFRNPLVSPDILGVSAGASLGAVLGIFLSLPIMAIQFFSFAGGLMAVALVYAAGTAIRNRDPVLVLVLVGMAVGALIGAAISLIKMLADPYDQLPAITYWLLGSLTAVSLDDLQATIPAFIFGFVPLLLLRWRINLLSLGDEDAHALGVNTKLLRPLLIASATLMTAAAVSIAGIVGWIGLVMPHIARMLVGPDYRRLLPTAMLAGAAYLVLVDILARTIAAIEIPLGILTATIGAPFFIWLLASGKRGW